jgi:putative transposase
MNENPAVIDVTSLMENPQAFKKLLMDQIRARGGTVAVDSKSIVQDLMKQTLEAFLELEMEEHLGYPPHAAEGRGSGNSRNGNTAKTLRGDFGEVAIETPRDRNGIATGNSNRKSLPSGRPRSAISPRLSFRFTRVA